MRFHSCELDSGTRVLLSSSDDAADSVPYLTCVCVKADVIKRSYHTSNQTAQTGYLNNESRRLTRCHLKVFFRSSVNTRESTKSRILNCVTLYNPSLTSYRTFYCFCFIVTPYGWNYCWMMMKGKTSPWCLHYMGHLLKFIIASLWWSTLITLVSVIRLLSLKYLDKLKSGRSLQHV